MTALASPSAIETVSSGRTRRAGRRTAIITTLSVLLVAMFATALMVGQTFTPPGDVLRVILGENVEGASFTVGVLRLPRAVMAIVAGMSFGLGGIAFQTMLRNPLASPDIIGINLGASAAAVFAIVVLQLNGPAVSLFAIVSGLTVAVAIYVLAFKGGVSGTRLILIGIGVSAMLQSVISYLLL
ncbi:MAG TPA: iron chelate uptake ABC transporter family permease subunit, partial [Devosia sp.]|nr:iron chelate uptake ABC transporter family permease subunit [Devosia sp.]